MAEILPFAYLFEQLEEALESPDSLVVSLWLLCLMTPCSASHMYSASVRISAIHNGPHWRASITGESCFECH